AHHWLSNAAQAPGLFGRLGVTRYPTGGYFDYPVGGMFWARVDAIRPLLDAGFSFDDFPVEAGQTDGTLAHAIERCFVPLARSQGYGFVAFDRDTGAFQYEWQSRNLDQYQQLSAGDLRRAEDEARRRRNWAGDVSLSEIYGEMSGVASWDDATLADGMATELAD